MQTQVSLARVTDQVPQEPRTPSVAFLVKQVIEEDNPTRVFDDLIPLLSALPLVKYNSYKAALKEHFKRRLSIVDLDKCMKEERKNGARARLQERYNPEQGTPRPVVKIGGQLRDVVQQGLITLELANKHNPSLFVMSGQLVTIHYSEENVPSITHVSLSRLRHKMSEAADYITVKATADDVSALPVDPPLDVTRVILEGMNPSEYPFPALTGVTELPILRQDGSIHMTAGYDTVTKQVYIPGGLLIPPVPETPSAEDVTTSLALIDYWFADFPFADQSSKATALADAITVVIRSVLNGQVPLTLLDAPKQGSGKTILAQAIGILATGRIVPTNAPTNEEEETRKKILTWLQTSPAVVIIDNIIHPLESSSLNSALTSPFIEDRALGSNTLIRVPNRAVWFASGNNIRVGDDTARRCIKCRLDAKMERPHTRTQFRIPGGVDGFFRWTLEHRAALVAAILVLARNWYAQGKPTPDVTPLGNFEGWTITVGGILQAAGVSGFLDNLSGENGESSIDEISTEWGAFIQTVYTIYGDNPFLCSDLAKEMIRDIKQAETLQETLPTSLTKSFDGYRKSQGQDRDFATHLSYAFRTRKGQIYGSLCLEAAGKNRMNKAQWRVSVQAPNTEHDSTSLDTELEEFTID